MPVCVLHSIWCGTVRNLLAYDQACANLLQCQSASLVASGVEKYAICLPMIRLVQTLLLCASAVCAYLLLHSKLVGSLCLPMIRPVQRLLLCAPSVLTCFCPRSGGQSLLAYDQACTDLPCVCTGCAYLLLPSKWWAVSASSASSTRNSKGAAVSAPMVAAIV